MFQMKASLLTTRATQPSSQTSESRQKDAYLQVNSLRRSLTWASSSTLNGLLCFQVMGSQWEKMIRLTIIGCTIMAWSFSKVRNYDKHSSTLNDCNFFWNEIQNCYIFFLLSSFLVTQSLSLFFFFLFCPLFSYFSETYRLVMKCRIRSQDMSLLLMKPVKLHLLPWTFILKSCTGRRTCDGVVFSLTSFLSFSFLHRLIVDMIVMFTVCLVTPQSVLQTQADLTPPSPWWCHSTTYIIFK